MRAFSRDFVCFGDSDLRHDFLLDRYSHQLFNFGLIGISRNDYALHGAGAANLAGDGAGIHVIEAGDSLFLQEVRQFVHHVAAGAFPTQLTDDESVDKGLSGLHEPLGDSVVAYQRIGQSHNLIAVGRIREDFLITGHTGVEYNLTCSFEVVQDMAVKYGTILKNEFT